MPGACLFVYLSFFVSLSLSLLIWQFLRTYGQCVLVDFGVVLGMLDLTWRAVCLSVSLFVSFCQSLSLSFFLICQFLLTYRQFVLADIGKVLGRLLNLTSHAAGCLSGCLHVCFCQSISLSLFVNCPAAIDSLSLLILV